MLTHYLVECGDVAILSARYNSWRPPALCFWVTGAGPDPHVAAVKDCWSFVVPRLWINYSTAPVRSLVATPSRSWSPTCWFVAALLEPLPEPLHVLLLFGAVEPPSCLVAAVKYHWSLALLPPREAQGGAPCRRYCSSHPCLGLVEAIPVPE